MTDNTLSSINTNTIKNYYIKIFELYNNCIDLLTALNQSLSTTSPEVVVTLENNTEYKIPSYVYLENRLNEISNNIVPFFKNKSFKLFKIITIIINITSFIF